MKQLTTADKAALDYRSPQQAATFWRGFEAGKSGDSEFTCPYNICGPYRSAWICGWRYGDEVASRDGDGEAPTPDA